MPELPDVEVIQQHLAERSLEKKIIQIEVNDDDVLKVSGQKLRSLFEKQIFSKTKRFGKYLFISTEEPKWLVMHFGMTGDLQHYKAEDPEPKYARVIFHFEDESHLAYISRRKLGFIDVADGPDEFAKEHELGPDALDITKQEFKSLLKNKRGMVKTALMDQSMISGLGNVYVDEILYQTNIHPKTKVPSLKKKQLDELYSNMVRILETAINNDAEREKMPNQYLINHRSDGAECPDCGGKIKRIKVSGRSTYFCPDCQKIK